MTDYLETTETGRKWRRAFHVDIRNPLEGVLLRQIIKPALKQNFLSLLDMKINKAAIPAAFLAALTSAPTLILLEQFEGNVLKVYPDKLAGGIPTYCAGKTDWNIPLGTTFTSDRCKEINKATILEYGLSILGCTKWVNLTPDRLVALTMFSINVGKSGACGSQAVKQINAGNIQVGCYLIAHKPSGAPNWSYSGGVYVQGLQNRRKIEAALCLKSS